jgi:cbb3-type cytochrome oxidase subunit 3
VILLLRALASPADAPLDPSPDEARSWLQRELLAPEYHQQNLVERLITWLARQIGVGVETPGLVSTFVTILIFLVLLGGLVWLLSRVQRDRRTRTAIGPVLGHEAVTAAELRARAEAALAEGRPKEALVDGFRALAVRQVERGRLDDSPGATAHEVALLLATEYPQHRAAVGDNALLFDMVLYGDRPATAEQATGVLILDDELAGAR